MINSEYGVGARKFIPDLVKYYEISLVDYIPITHKTYKLSTENGQQYFLKETTDSTLNKYQYLESKGISNVLYPILKGLLLKQITFLFILMTICLIFLCVMTLKPQIYLMN